MTRRRRIALGLAGLLLALVALFAAFIGWLLLTAAGLEWAAATARRYLPPEVAFERVTGRLAGPLEVQGLTVATDRAEVRVGRVRLDWRPWALLGGRLRVTELAAGPVAVELAATPGDEPAPGAAPPSLPALPSDLSIPFAIDIDRAIIEPVRLRLADGSEQRLERLRLGASLGPDGLALNKIDVAGPLLDLQGRLRVAGIRPFGVGGDLQWRVRPPDPAIAAMTGRLELAGTLADTRLRLAWREPDTATLSARVRAFRDTPEWSVELALPVTGLQAWWRSAPALEAGAALRLAGTLERASVQGTLDIAGLPVGPLHARVDATGTLDSVQLRQLRLAAERHPDLRLEANGELRLGAAQPQFDATLTWRALRWPLAETPVVRSASGRLAIRGTPGAYTLDGSAEVTTPRTGAEPVRLQLGADGSSEALSGLELEATWHAARLDARGEVRWLPSGSADLRFELAGLDPGRLRPGLSGRVAARGRVQGTWGEALTAALELDSFQGELNGQPLSGTARVRHQGGVARIDSLTLQAGPARASVAGSVGATLDLDWRVAVPRLQALLPGWSGRIDAQGRATGTAQAPQLTVRAGASGVVTPALQVGSLGLEGTVAPLGGARTELQLDAAGLVADAVTVEGLAARLSGTPEDHRLTLTLRSSRGDAEVVVTGAARGTDWSGRLREAVLVPERLGRWTLAEPAQLSWQDGALVAGPACWRQGDARLCGSARGAPGDWRLRLRAERMPVARFAALARPELDYFGTFDLQAELDLGSGAPSGRAALQLSPGRIDALLEEEPTTVLDYGAARAALELTPAEVAVEVDLPLSAGGRVRLDGRLGHDAPRALQARLQADVGELGLLAALSPAVGRVEGRLLADLEVGGTLEQPTAAGSARLESGRIEVLPLGIELTGIRADLATGERALDLTLAARSGDGELRARARIEPGADGGWRGSGTIEGDSVLAARLPEAEVLVSPRLQWQLAGRDLSLSGRVEVPRALIAPRDLSGAVQPTADAVMVGGEARAPAQPPLRMDADVEVVLGPEVRIDAFGLEARLEGSVRVREEPGRLTSGTGELRVVEGTYTFYRQRLEIERGRVIFDGGPIGNPGLDVRAVRRPRGVLVGVNVRGTLRNPRVELFSEPPMEQSQQLSYLVVGIPLGETSGGEQEAVAAAAAALARSEEGSALAGRVGIQEVTVDRGEPGEGASIVLGRYLSPRLYVGYGIGLMEQANSVRMRYDLTEHWKLEARSGITSSADLLYSIEVDRSADAIPELPLPDLGGESAAEGGE